MSEYEKTATIRLEKDGEIIWKNFAGHEWEIGANRTQLVKVMGGEGALKFVWEVLDTAMWDALLRSNLIPTNLRPLEQRTAKKVAAQAQVEGTAPRTFVSKADRRQHEKTLRRLGQR